MNQDTTTDIQLFGVGYMNIKQQIIFSSCDFVVYPWKDTISMVLCVEKYYTYTVYMYLIKSLFI